MRYILHHMLLDAEAGRPTKPRSFQTKYLTLEQLELKSNNMMIKSSHNEMAAHASLDISALCTEITMLPMLMSARKVLHMR